MELPSAKRVHPVALTQAFQAAVGTVEGIRVLPGRILVKGATDADRAALQSVLDAHDPTVVEQTRAQRHQRFQAVLRELEEAEGAWESATPTQRMATLRNVIQCLVLGQRLGRW